MEHIPQRKQDSQRETPKNVEMLDLSDARYRLIYERHDMVHSPEEIGTPDACAFECIMNFDFAADPGEANQALDALWATILTDRVQRGFGTSSQIEAFQEDLRTKRMPLCLVDAVDPHQWLWKLEIYRRALAGGEIGAGAGIAGLGVRSILEKPELSRRTFLTSLVATIGATKAFGNAVERVANFESPHGSVTMNKKIASYNEMVNPEVGFFVLRLRNAVWAHKLHALAVDLTKEKGQKPEIAMLLGRGHVGVEEMLRAEPAERLELINKSLMALKVLLGLRHGIKFSSVARFDYDVKDGQWTATQTYHDPEIARLEGESTALDYRDTLD